jgi:hypothetical protein
MFNCGQLAAASAEDSVWQIMLMGGRHSSFGGSSSLQMFQLQWITQQKVEAVETKADALKSFKQHILG